MQTARSMFLNHESRCAFDFFRNGLADRLASLLKVAFAFVFGECHSNNLTTDCMISTRRCRGERRYKDLAFARQRFAYEIADEPANDNVFAKLGNLCVEQVVNRDVRIFDETLLEQANRAIEFFEFAFHNFVRYMGGLALHLRVIDLALGFDEIPGNIGPTNVQGMRRGDMQRDVFDKLPEILVSRHKIGFAVHLDEHTDFSLQMNIRGDDRSEERRVGKECRSGWLTDQEKKQRERARDVVR